MTAEQRPHNTTTVPGLGPAAVAMPAVLRERQVRAAGFCHEVSAMVLVLHATLRGDDLHASDGRATAFVPAADRWLEDLVRPRLGPEWDASRSAGVPAVRLGSGWAGVVRVAPVDPSAAPELVGGWIATRRARARLAELAAAWDEPGLQPLVVAWPLFANRARTLAICAITGRPYQISHVFTPL